MTYINCYLINSETLNNFTREEETIVYPENYFKNVTRNVNSQWMAVKLAGYVCILSGVHVPVLMETGS